jgi:hypothetical protein
VTHPLKIFVCNKGKAELGATPEDTSRTTFPESLEALLSPWITRGNMSIMWVHGGSANCKSRIRRGLTNFTKSVQRPFVIRLALPSLSLETCLYDILKASSALPLMNTFQPSSLTERSGQIGGRHATIEHRNCQSGNKETMEEDKTYAIAAEAKVSKNESCFPL